MGVLIDGYTCTNLVRASRLTRTYEATRDDGLPVLLELVELSASACGELLACELERAHALDIKTLAPTLALERRGPLLLLSFARPHAVDLRQLGGGRPLGLETFLPIARRTTEMLAELHAHALVHGQLCPGSVVVNPDDGELSFAPFACASLLAYELDELERLHYCSPEHTGRGHAGLDERSDLYSLGAVFFRLLTGTTVFAHTRAAALIQAHLSERPADPRAHQPALPSSLCAIVLRLLSKAPADRYHSATQLLAELDRIKLALDEGELAMTESSTDASDRGPRARLFGREHELLDAHRELARCVELGRPRLLLITGAAGLGKTTLAAALEPELLSRGALIGRGSFEPERRRLPYLGWIRALDDVLGQLLLGPHELLEAKRALLEQRLGRLSPLLVELVPKLATVLGELPPAPPRVGLAASRNRMQLAFARLLDALADGGALTLVFDDLHAAEPDSLELLDALLDGGNCGPVLFVACARAQQHAPAVAARIDKLAARIEPLRETSLAQGRALALTELDPTACEQLVRARVDPARQAATLSFAARHGGNPQLLLEFAEQPERRERAALERPALLHAYLRARLDALDERVAALLRHAACVGASFDLPTLARALDEAPAALLEPLARCCSAGLLQRRGASFRFVHAGLRELAATTLLPEFRRMLDERVADHARARAGSCTWICVDRRDAGFDALAPTMPAQRLELARRNLDIAQRSIELTAHAAALAYVEFALALIHALPGERELGFELEFTHMQALELTGEHERAQASFEQLLARCSSDREHARLVSVRLELLHAGGRNEQAVALGLAALRRYDCELDEAPGTTSMLLALTRAWLGSRRVSTRALLELPPATDPRARACMDIAAALAPASYAVDPRLFVSLSAVQVSMLLRHGSHPNAASALAHFAVPVAKVLRRIDDGLRLAECAMAIAGDPEQPDYTRTEVAASLVFSLARPLAASASALELAYQRSLQLGEFESVSFLASLRNGAATELGTPLRTVIRDCQSFERELGNWATPTMRTLVRISGAFAAALVGDVDPRLGVPPLPIDPATLVGATAMEHCAATLMRACYFVLIGEHAEGLQLFDGLDDYERVLMGSWLALRGALMHGVAAAACHERAGPREQRRLERLLAAKLQSCQSWAETNVANFGPQRDIVLAEHSALLGNHARALRLLERARTHAGDGTYVAALACERMAAHTRARGLPILASGALREAWQIYRRWGARTKLRALELEQASREASLGERGELEVESSMGLGKLAIDLESVTNTLTRIAEELDHERLAVTILTAALEHGGADQGALLIDLDHALVVVALARDGQPVRALSPARDFTEVLDLLPVQLIESLVHAQHSVVIDDASGDPSMLGDPYVERTGVRALAGVQLRKREARLGLLIVEHHQRAGCFDDERVAVLGFIATAAAAALDNAKLYRALARSESRWRSLVDSAPDLIALLDDHGRLSFINHALPGWVVGHAPTLTPDSLAEWNHSLARALELGQLSAIEIAVPHDDGAVLWYEAHFALVEHDGEHDGERDGGMQRVMVIATEITERKASEALRSAMEGQLRQQQRLESVGTLASGVAHEINNPIQGILNYAELTLRARNDPELVSDFAAEIMTEAERVATIVRNLLAFSRREATPERELVRLHEIVRGTLTLVQSSLRSSQIELVLAVPEELPPVHCHAQQIQQVIMNLVTNARDTLNERWPEHHVDKRIELRGSIAARGYRAIVRLSVIDHGLGISTEVLPHIFDPFFTTKGRDRGTGLGLSVSHGIAVDHGGELWVESEFGVGSRFHLDLPVGDDELRARG